jgi:Flp pilus assembly protein TadD
MPIDPIDRIARLRAAIGGPRDGALLRHGLATALFECGDFSAAADSARAAVGFDPGYSAAWKLLGHALERHGDLAGAADAWRRGIAAATGRGDVQAAKEMRVFLRRLEKRLDGEPPV